MSPINETKSSLPLLNRVSEKLIILWCAFGLSLVSFSNGANTRKNIEGHTYFDMEMLHRRPKHGWIIVNIYRIHRNLFDSACDILPATLIASLCIYFIGVSVLIWDCFKILMDSRSTEGNISNPLTTMSSYAWICSVLLDKLVLNGVVVFRFLLIMLIARFPSYMIQQNVPTKTLCSFANNPIQSSPFTWRAILFRKHSPHQTFDSGRFVCNVYAVEYVWKLLI